MDEIICVEGIILRRMEEVCLRGAWLHFGQAEILSHLTAEESGIVAEDDGQEASPSEVCSSQNISTADGKEALPGKV